MSSSAITIRPVAAGDLDVCYAIEAACYGPEGATRERIERRIASYPQGFLVAELDGPIAGFINSGATHRDDIGDEAFKDMVGHEEDGRNIVVFSLAVRPQSQGRGISRQLMERFIEVSGQLRKENILLLCQTELIAYYQKYGFVHRGPSSSDHGGLRWHEMRLNLNLDRTRQ